MLKFYQFIGILSLVAMGWAQFTGYAVLESDRIKDVPHSVRDNPGSYRSHYTFFYHHSGGK